MRYLIVTLLALAAAACASSQPAPTPAPAPQAAAPEAKAPQCWSSDHGKFFGVGERTSISGVDVACEKTSDGKNAQWMGRKH